METEKLSITFNESLSDSSIKLIQKILKDSLNYNTIIERIN